MTLKPMDRIATCVGWVAITAARLETVIGVIVAYLLDEEGSAELLGRSWSRVYEDAKKVYRDLVASALHAGDDVSAEACESFTRLLHDANNAMTQRHHVLYATWTANRDVVTRDGASFAFGATERMTRKNGASASSGNWLSTSMISTSARFPSWRASSPSNRALGRCPSLRLGTAPRAGLPARA
jgi:hypothetical protein